MKISIGKLRKEEEDAYRQVASAQLSVFHRPLSRKFVFTSAQKKHVLLSIAFSVYGPPPEEDLNSTGNDTSLDLRDADAQLALYSKKQHKAVERIYNAITK